MSHNKSFNNKKIEYYFIYTFKYNIKQWTGQLKNTKNGLKMDNL